MSEDSTPAPRPTPASMPRAVPKPGPVQPGAAQPSASQPGASQHGATPGAGPRPGPPPGGVHTGVPTPPHGVATVHAPAAEASEEAKRFGRVAEDGTVYVRTPDGERAVGSYPGASPD